MIAQALILLHHLVFNAQPTFNLQHCLQMASHRRFNGINHMFIVTLGRLSYADAPEWLEADARTELEQVAGVSDRNYVGLFSSSFNVLSSKQR
jgi:hypothetical protein